MKQYLSNFSSIILFIFCCSIVTAQNELPNNSSSILSAEELTTINEELPPNLHIEQTGQILENNARADVYLWDSTHSFGWDINNANWNIYEKQKAILYNAEGEILEIKTEVLNAIGNFEPNRSINYSYNANGYEIVGQTWNGVAWDLSYKAIYQLNTNGYMTAYERYDYDLATSLWIPDSKMVLTHNNQNLVTSSKRYGLNNTNSSWRPINEIFMSYNSNNKNVEHQSYYQWNAATNNWNNITLDSAFYDANGFLILQKSYSWDNGNSIFSLNTQNLITTDANDNITQNIRQTWTNQVWLNANRYLITYNSNNQRTEQTFESWDNSANQWLPSYKDEMTYNTNNKETLFKLSIWDNGVWKITQRNINIYDNNDLPIRFEGYYYDANTGNLTGGSARDNYYSLYTITSTERLQSESIQVYPNPTNGQVVVNLPENFTQGQVRIWDMQGRLMKFQDYEGNMLDLSSFSNGVYWLQFMNEDQKYSTKVIKH